MKSVKFEDVILDASKILSVRMGQSPHDKKIMGLVIVGVILFVLVLINIIINHGNVAWYYYLVAVLVLIQAVWFYVGSRDKLVNLVVTYKHNNETKKVQQPLYGTKQVILKESYAFFEQFSSDELKVDFIQYHQIENFETYQ